MLPVAIACLLATTATVTVEEKPAKPESLLFEEEEMIVADTEELEDLTGEIVFEDTDEDDPDDDGSDEE